MEASLSLDSSEEEASVGPGEPGMVRFTGVLTCNISGIGQNTQTINVQLSAKAGEWPVSVTNDIEIEPDDEKTVPIEAIVRVPNFTSSTETGKLVISGVATLDPGGQTYQIEPVEGEIIINPYYLLSLNCLEPYLEADGGETVFFRLTVTNNGNIDTTVLISIYNEDKLNERGFEIELSDEEVFIIEGGMADIQITVELTDTDKEELNNLQVKVKATIPDDTYRPELQYYEFYVRIKPGGVYYLIDQWIYIIVVIGIISFISLGIFILRKKTRARRRK